MMRAAGIVCVVLLVVGCNRAKDPIPAGGDLPRLDGIPVADATGDVGPAADQIPGADSLAGEDIVLPEDTIPDAPPDAVIPEGCCLTDADCADSGTGPAKVCAGKGMGDPVWAGICVNPSSETGRCWADSECPGGQVCHGVQLCGCNKDCDMDMMESQGICITPGAACQALDPTWADEVCDAAHLVVWDGQACVHTCLGCCGCQGWCEHTFQTVEDCQAACYPSECPVYDGSCDDAMPEEPWWYWNGQTCLMEDTCVCEVCPGTFATLEACKYACGFFPDCPDHVTALAESYYGVYTGDDTCPAISEMTVRCESDADCAALADAGLAEFGETCVLGSCVWCWKNDECPPGAVCRAGRCVENSYAGCPSPGACGAPGCHLITLSEVPCPVCTCDGIYDLSCHTDEQCLLYSSHPYSRCVYGRCADCRNDEDCEWGRCMQPGICYETTPPEDLLFGTWLLGWSGGLDHFSYFRFEPDGTFRRSRYDEDPMGTFVDDIAPFWDVCDPGSPLPAPLVGTWEPEVTQSGLLVIRVRLNLPCAEDQGWTVRWAVEPVIGGGWTADFLDIDGGMDLMGFKVDGMDCLPDFSECVPPLDPWL